MASVGFITLPDVGHMNPMLSLGRTLRDRGHAVTFFQLGDLQARIEAAGLRAAVIGGRRLPAGTLAARHNAIAAASGLASVRLSMRHAESLTRSFCEDVPRLARREGIDVLVVDQLEPSGASIAHHLDVPFVTAANSIAFIRDPNAPPAFTSWHFLPGTARRWRNHLAFRVFDVFAMPLGRVVNGYRRQWHLAPLRRIDDGFSPFAQLTQQPPLLDFPGTRVPPHFHYVGPLRDRQPAPVPFPWHRLTEGRPLIYASLGTLQNRRREMFTLIAAAVRGLDVDVVIPHGGVLDSAAQAEIGQDVVLVDYAPQDALIARASVVITHGGINTVLDALSHAVPVVAIPFAHDAPGTAERVRVAGAGEVLNWKRLQPSRLRDVVTQVLTRGKYRAHAERLRQDILRAGGVQRAATIVERVGATRAPVTAPN